MQAQLSCPSAATGRSLHAASARPNTVGIVGIFVIRPVDFLAPHIWPTSTITNKMAMVYTHKDEL
jgi:hypothetical protein